MRYARLVGNDLAAMSKLGIWFVCKGCGKPAAYFPERVVESGEVIPAGAVCHSKHESEINRVPVQCLLFIQLDADEYWDVHKDAQRVEPPRHHEAGEDVSREREAYGSPQLSFGVRLFERAQATIPDANTPVLLHQWTWGPYVVHECPSCRCTPDRPCTIALEDDCGEAACVPPGAYGLPACSKCYQGTT